MNDVVDAVTRSRMMASIRDRNTKPELAVRRGLHAKGFRYRLHAGDLPGRPDIVLPKHHAVVFVHGCFWHRHDGCNYAAMPASRQGFWKRKFDENRSRDRRAVEALRRLGWRVFIVWECGMKHDPEGTIRELARLITDDSVHLDEIPSRPIRTGRKSTRE